MKKYPKLQALILFTLVSLVLTWPLLLHITTHYPSTFPDIGGDPNMYIWFMDSVAKKALNPSLDLGQMLFYPLGMNFLAGYEAPIILLVSTPIILFTHNPIFAYNIILLLGFILTGYSCYLLIEHLTKSYWPSVLAGMSFGFSTYMIVRGTQHLDLLFIFPVVLVVMFGIKFTKHPDRANIIKLTLALILTALSAWYYLVGSLIFLGLLFLFSFKEFLAAKKQYIIAAICAGVAIGLTALPMFLNRSDLSFKYVDTLIDVTGSNPANYFVPHPYIVNSTWQVYENFYSPYESTSYFGLVGLIAIFTLIAWRKKVEIPNRKLWITTIIVFLLIASGTYIYVMGQKIPMPFSFLRNIIPFSRLRAPNRFFIFAYLATTVIFGYFLAYAKMHLRPVSKLKISAVLLIVLLLGERLIMPYPLFQPTVPQFYKDIGQSRENFAIVDLPLINPGLSLYNFYQIYHGKQIVDGEYFWTAYNPHTFDFIASNSLLRNSELVIYSKSLKATSCNNPKGTIDSKAAIKQLADANIRYVVVHNLIIRKEGCGTLATFIRQSLQHQKMVFSDGDITVYSTIDKLEQ